MEGAAAVPPHPWAAAAPGRPWSRRSGAPGCGDVSCARRCMAPARSRGRPRPAASSRTPAHPGKRSAGGSGSSPPPVRPPSAPRPHVSRRPPGPLPQGSGTPRRPPAHVRPGWLSAAGLGARASRRRLAALLPSLFLSARSQAMLALARSLSRTAHALRLALGRRRRRSRRPYLYGERQRDVNARSPASFTQPIRAAGRLKGRCRYRRVCVGPAGRR